MSCDVNAGAMSARSRKTQPVVQRANKTWWPKRVWSQGRIDSTQGGAEGAEDSAETDLAVGSRVRLSVLDSGRQNRNLSLVGV